MKTTVTRSQKKAAVRSGQGPTHKEISSGAEALWLKKGCPQGADDEIWLEAERQLLLRGAGRPGEAKGALGGLRREEFKSDSLMSDLDELYPGPAGRETTSL